MTAAAAAAAVVIVAAIAVAATAVAAAAAVVAAAAGVSVGSIIMSSNERYRQKINAVEVINIISMPHIMLLLNIIS